MLSHPGLVRAVNEDAVAYRIPRQDEPGAQPGMLALVADGMGGHAAGEVASQIAAQTLHLVYYQGEKPPRAALAEGFAAANEAIYARSQTDPDCAGMGTTCTVLAVQDNRLWLGHVGDSRAYIVRDNKIHQISQDHSLVAELVRDGTLSPEEAATSPDRNVILRALGTEPAAKPDVWEEGLPLRDGDILILCSDGLSDLLDNTAVLAAVTEHAPLDACQRLIDAALEAGGDDNISVGVFAITAESAEAAPPARTTRTIDIAALPEDPQ
ncbi:MAG: Stp1/IreP family PP2C-type Ser/Thr phosphatase [Acetobacteraceae bacterium]|nr:Stp1/IreP family PP2C-type Ser/Thr phosphatase [Acetobacteraceae bacterium]